MLDENLPAFFLKPSSSGVKHHRELHLTYHGSDPEPAYLLHHPDPASPSPTNKNCYAAALFDAYNPDILFGEVLARPGWTQATLSAEELRQTGGIPPPPQPMLPTDFSIQLYNPDQQVKVELKQGKWGGSDSYEFSLPQDVFRTPSASTLDRGQSDPASLAITPRFNFVWKKESKLGKDLTCFMTGKSTDNIKKKRDRKDPDIAIGLWRSMRELTLYEPNLARIEMEDPKGLEVVLLLSAIAIKDIYFNSKEQMRQVFNITETSTQGLRSGGRKLSNPKAAVPTTNAPNPVQPARTSANDAKRDSLPRLQTAPPKPSNRPPPVADPRAKWELEAETARLKAQAEAEKREAARRRRDKDRADEAERQRLLKMVEEEERQARMKQAQVEQETAALRKQYGVQALPTIQPPQNSSNSSRPRQQKRSSHLQPIPQGQQPTLGSNGLYVQPAASSSNLYMSGAAANASNLSVTPNPNRMKKKSFFGLRSHSDDGGLAEQHKRLAKKQSTLW